MQAERTKERFKQVLISAIVSCVGPFGKNIYGGLIHIISRRISFQFDTVAEGYLQLINVFSKYSF